MVAEGREQGEACCGQNGQDLQRDVQVNSEDTMSKSQAQRKSTMKKVTDYLRRTLFSCFSATNTTTSSSFTAAPTTTTAKNRVSFSFPELFRGRHAEQPPQEPQEEDSLIDAAAAAASKTPPHQHRRHCRRRHHQGPPPTPSRSVIVGTIFGRRRGRVSFCVQRDPAAPPPFLFELSVPTHALAAEMHSGLLRVALECNRCPSSSSAMWKAYCNGRNVGYAVRRRPTESDRRILESVRLMSAGAGVLCPAEEDKEKAAKEGELMYMRATYDRVVGSRDSVSYHLINPGGGACSSPPQELSVFLLRTG